MRELRLARFKEEVTNDFSRDFRNGVTIEFEETSIRLSNFSMLNQEKVQHLYVQS